MGHPPLCRQPTDLFDAHGPVRGPQAAKPQLHRRLLVADRHKASARAIFPLVVSIVHRAARRAADSDAAQILAAHPGVRRDQTRER